MTEDLNIQQVEQEIEISIEAARDVVERKNKVAKLFENKLFKEIVEEGYFTNEAARLVSLLSESVDPDSGLIKEELINDMMGISAFRRYLLNVHRLGVQMEKQIAASEVELERIRIEQENQDEQGE